MRLDRTHLAEVVLDHLRHRAGQLLALRHASRQKAVHRDIGVEVLKQTRIGPAQAAGRVYAEQRWLGAARAEREENSEGVLPDVQMQLTGEPCDGRRLEQGPDRQIRPEHGADATDSARVGQVGPQLSDVCREPGNWTPYRNSMTVFDSTGYALEDHTALDVLIELAQETGVGERLLIEHLPVDALDPYAFAG